MKISNLTTDEALDILCELTPYIGNIVTDEELLEELKNKIENGRRLTKAEIYALGIGKINALVPILLKKRREDIFAILAILNHKTAEEIAKQNFIVTGGQIREIIRDKELLNFFKSFVDGEGNG